MNLGRHISHGFYRVSDAEAGRMAREVGAKLPRYGYELRLDHGALMRTPYRHHADAPKRGWVWAVLVDDDWVTSQSKAARRKPQKPGQVSKTQIASEIRVAANALLRAVKGSLRTLGRRFPLEKYEAEEVAGMVI